MQKSRNVADVHHLQREVGTKLDRTRTRERIMELEIAIIDEQGLTLSPASSPMHPSERETHLDWRRRRSAKRRVTGAVRNGETWRQPNLRTNLGM